MRSQFLVAACVLVTLGGATAIGLAQIRQEHQAANHRSRAPHTIPSAAIAESGHAEPVSATPARVGPFARLEPITFVNRNSRELLGARLYSDIGQIDEEAAEHLDRFLADNRKPQDPQTKPIDRRLLQLLFRAAYHFHAARVEVTSGYRMQRRRREGLHALGRAVDFALSDVKAEQLAAYLRQLPRVGVGIYTHPRTRFVHLDVRPESYHWLDASPPGRTWRGLPLHDRSLPERDARYRPEDDLPEGTAPIEK